ncbi:hypothetical protein NDU88_005477 [Pleurodeles waltl]|uniref:Uncharacterized protein n=1 Tax=Pleurodeles waltl TaxID=8319 RepID=A0AAV7NQD8_PLEWA|nr:hypothetical protein NDU88_005477 [Pleurodeles waltl]
MTEAPPTGWRCFQAHSDSSGKAAVGKPGPAVSRRFCPGWANPPGQRCKQGCPGDSDPLTVSLFLAVFTARKRLATVKSATGATAPVAPPQLRRLHSEPTPVLRPPFPLGRPALTWLAPAGPAGMSEWGKRYFGCMAAKCRFPPGGQLPPPARVRIRALVFFSKIFFSGTNLPVQSGRVVVEASRLELLRRVGPSMELFYKSCPNFSKLLGLLPDVLLRFFWGPQLNPRVQKF